MVLSGTDYNINMKCPDGDLLNTLKLFKRYYKSKSALEFYEWVDKHVPGHIDNIDTLYKVNKMFDLKNTVLPVDMKIISTREIKIKELRNLLIENGFIFT